jgi:hypothetical protein
LPILGLGRKKKVVEEVAAEPEPIKIRSGPALVLLIPEVAGGTSFRALPFDFIEDAIAHLESMLPAAVPQIHAFWAMMEKPGDASLGGEATVLIRSEAGGELVYVVSFVDIESALAFARFEVKRGMALGQLMIYWAEMVTIEMTEEGIFLTPEVAPRPGATPVLQQTAPAEAHVDGAPAIMDPRGDAVTEDVVDAEPADVHGGRPTTGWVRRETAEEAYDAPSPVGEAPVIASEPVEREFSLNPEGVTQPPAAPDENETVDEPRAAALPEPEEPGFSLNPQVKPVAAPEAEPLVESPIERWQAAHEEPDEEEIEFAADPDEAVPAWVEEQIEERETEAVAEPVDAEFPPEPEVAVEALEAEETPPQVLTDEAVAEAGEGQFAPEPEIAADGAFEQGAGVAGELELVEEVESEQELTASEETVAAEEPEVVPEAEIEPVAEPEPMADDEPEPELEVVDEPEVAPVVEEEPVGQAEAVAVDGAEPEAELAANTGVPEAGIEGVGEPEQLAVSEPEPAEGAEAFAVDGAVLEAELAAEADAPEAEIEPVEEPEPIVVSEPQPADEAEAVAVDEAEPIAEVEPEPEAEIVAESAVATEAETEAVGEQEADALEDLELEPEVTAESEFEAEPTEELDEAPDAPEPEAELAIEPDVEPQPIEELVSVAVDESDVEAQLAVDPDASLGVEPEAVDEPEAVAVEEPEAEPQLTAAPIEDQPAEDPDAVGEPEPAPELEIDPVVEAEPVAEAELLGLDEPVTEDHASPSYDLPFEEEEIVAEPPSFLREDGRDESVSEWPDEPLSPQSRYEVAEDADEPADEVPAQPASQFKVTFGEVSDDLLDEPPAEEAPANEWQPDGGVAGSLAAATSGAHENGYHEEALAEEPPETIPGEEDLSPEMAAFLKSRRRDKKDNPFRGFESPPGRF